MTKICELNKQILSQDSSTNNESNQLAHSNSSVSTTILPSNGSVVDPLSTTINASHSSTVTEGIY